MSHETSSLAMRRDSIEASAQQCAKHLEAAFKATSGIADLQIQAVNAMREAGISANLASGREQLVFNAAGCLFARKNIMPHLPEWARLEHVQFAVHLAGILPKPVESLEELRPFRRELQLMLGLYGVTDKPKRIEQTAHEKNAFIDVLYRVRMLERVIDDLVEEEPVDKWPDHKVEEFIRDTKPAREWLDKIEAEAKERGINT